MAEGRGLLNVVPAFTALSIFMLLGLYSEASGKENPRHLLPPLPPLATALAPSVHFMYGDVFAPALALASKVWVQTVKRSWSIKVLLSIFVGIPLLLQTLARAMLRSGAAAALLLQLSAGDAARVTAGLAQLNEFTQVGRCVFLHLNFT